MSATDEWHEDDEFWERMAGVMFAPAQWEAAELAVDDLLELVDPPAGAEVLDVACGPGRHAIELAERGYRVTGVDRTAAYLERARYRAAQAGVSVAWEEGDMRSFCRPERYDLVVNLYTSFGYFDVDENRRTMQNFYASLDEEGKLVVEMVGKEFIARNFRERTWEELEDGSIFLAHREIEGAWKWMHNDWQLIEPDGTRHSFEMRHRLYSAAELEGLMKGVGFEEVEVHGGFDGSAYGPDSSRLVAVGRK